MYLLTFLPSFYSLPKRFVDSTGIRLRDWLIDWLFVWLIIVLRHVDRILVINQRLLLVLKFLSFPGDPHEPSLLRTPERQPIVDHIMVFILWLTAIDLINNVLNRRPLYWLILFYLILTHYYSFANQIHPLCYNL